MANLNAKEYQCFEEIKHTTDEGVEFWYARELAPVLEYAKWDNFRKVVDKAMLACQNSFVLGAICYIFQMARESDILCCLLPFEKKARK